MTYFLAYELTSIGLSRVASLFRIKSNHVEMKSIHVELVHDKKGAPVMIGIDGKEIDNIYNDVYFVFVDSADLRARRSFVRITFEPLWMETFVVRTFVDYYIYAFKLLYSKSVTERLPHKMTIKELHKYAKKIVNDTFKEYKEKVGKINTRNYILAVNNDTPLYVPKTFIPPIHVNVYIVEPIGMNEVLQIMKEYEPVILWELI